MSGVRPVVEQVLSGRRILVIDDLEDARDLLMLILASVGVDAAGVGSASTAIEALDRSVPDLILCDINLPDGDGVSLMGEFRAIADARGETLPPVVAVTAFTDPAIHQQIYGHGFRALLVKPIDPHVLLETIRRALS